MTVKEKIQELNKKFQTCYHDQALTFFTHEGPAKINEIISLIEVIKKKNPKLETDLDIARSIDRFKEIIQDMKSGDTHAAYAWTEIHEKDKLLNLAKAHVSQACMNLWGKLWNYSEAVLEQHV